MNDSSRRPTFAKTVCPLKGPAWSPLKSLIVLLLCAASAFWSAIGCRALPAPTSTPISTQVELSEEYPTGTSFMGIRLLGTLALSNASVNGIRLSGLAWDEDEQTLYAPENSALVDMAALPDGSLLTLERAYASPFQPLIISLRRVWLLAWPGTDPPPKVEEVAVLDSGQALIHHQTPKKNLVGPEQSGR